MRTTQSKHAKKSGNLILRINSEKYFEHSLWTMKFELDNL